MKPTPRQTRGDGSSGDEADVLARPSFAEVLASLERMVLAQKSLDAGGPHVEEVT